ncbi:hypothetical protein GOODEAATRI_014946, partial [Goodea atripinnis]
FSLSPSGSPFSALGSTLAGYSARKFESPFVHIETGQSFHFQAMVKAIHVSFSPIF